MAFETYSLYEGGLTPLTKSSRQNPKGKRRKGRKDGEPVYTTIQGTTNMTGKVSLWIPSRNFGFIISEEKRYFLHVSRIKSGVPSVGAECSFDVSPIREGSSPTAINVTFADTTSNNGGAL